MSIIITGAEPAGASRPKACRNAKNTIAAVKSLIKVRSLFSTRQTQSRPIITAAASRTTEIRGKNKRAEGMETIMS